MLMCHKRTNDSQKNSRENNKCINRINEIQYCRSNQTPKNRTRVNKSKERICPKTFIE